MPVRKPHYLYGFQDPGGEQPMIDAGKPGWVTVSEEIGHNPGSTINHLQERPGITPQNPHGEPVTPDKYPKPFTHFVFHHSAPRDTVKAEQMARYHVEELNWPGIGYHFVAAADGTIQQTNELTSITGGIRCGK